MNTKLLEEVTRNIIEELARLFDTNTTKDEREEAPAKLANKLQLSDVRAKLADISVNGKTEEIKSLLTKYGAKRLSDIPEESYADLLADAEKLTA